MSTLEADFVVIGAGSAGCALAARLAGYADASVAILEAGGPGSHPLIRMPVAWMRVMAMPRFGWGINSEPDPHMDGRVQPLPRGRVLGGCSTINGTMYIRGMAADYDGWRDAGLPGWGYADVLPYFKRAETNWRGAGPEHGGSGPLSVTPLAPHARIYPAFLAAAKELGYAEIADFSVAAPEGFCMPDCTISDGRRVSTWDAYLKPALVRRNLRLESGAQVRRILFEAGRATGVEFERDGRRATLRARREVILCAGAFHSPHLLMHSGIGPAAELQRHGIQPLVDLPGVGANLQDHAIAQSIWKARVPITFERELRLDRLLLNVLRWSLTGRGSPAQSPLSIQGFIRSGRDTQRPDLQFQASHVSYAARPWLPLLRPGAGHEVSAGTLLLSPQSRGRVSLASADPRDLPRVLLNFMAAEEDRRRLREAMHFMRRFFLTGPAQSIVDQEIAPGAAVESDDALDAWLRASVISGAHPTSTCAMGTGPEAVVDAQLRVRGVAALRIADCSIMPRIIRGNTNAPAIMIGEKAADLVLERPPPH
ncbi:MAG: GMC family oxidoreductase N-terminal domain-containing protein [Gammaproteobacteria bacterium]|nr:GMC family oxidoreductase N-terminal domain-containing protein [Gammaproteobacteria bacterium]